MELARDFCIGEMLWVLTYRVYPVMGSTVGPALLFSPGSQSVSIYTLKCIYKGACRPLCSHMFLLCWWVGSGNGVGWQVGARQHRYTSNTNNNKLSILQPLSPQLAMRNTEYWTGDHRSKTMQNIRIVPMSCNIYVRDKHCIALVTSVTPWRVVHLFVSSTFATNPSIE